MAVTMAIALRKEQLAARVDHEPAHISD